MKIKIELSNETLQAIKNGKCLEGSLRMQQASKGTGEEIVFRAYQRKTRAHKKDKVIAHLEHGWLKESAERYKFFSSVKKTLEIPRVEGAMKHDMNTAMDELERIGTCNRVDKEVKA